MSGYSHPEFRVMKSKWWPGYVLQQRSDYMGWWSTVARYQSIDEANAECRALIRANGGMP